MGSDGIRIEEVGRETAAGTRLRYAYTTPGHYRVKSEPHASGWRLSLDYESFPAPVEKSSESTLFEPFVPEPRVFAARLSDRTVGWIELGWEAWCNRLRVWELLVDAACRRGGVGRALMARAREEAERRGARMIVLETQSCNLPAIAFYRSLGFDWLGCDLAHYSNQDVARGEVRIEMGLRLGCNAPDPGTPGRLRSSNAHSPAKAPQ